MRPDRRRARRALGIPEVKRGARRRGAAGCSACRARIPYHVAMELALTGDPIGAERAYELGIVNRLTEPGGRSTPRGSWPR